MYSAGMLPVALVGQQSYVTHPGILNQLCVQPYNAGSAGQLVGSLQPAEQPLKALRDYRCGYCGIPRTSSSTDAHRRVRIRCGCGGITQDQNARTHEHWLPLSRIPLYSFLVELPVLSSQCGSQCGALSRSLVLPRSLMLPVSLCISRCHLDNRSVTFIGPVSFSVGAVGAAHFTVMFHCQSFCPILTLSVLYLTRALYFRIRTDLRRRRARQAGNPVLKVVPKRSKRPWLQKTMELLVHFLPKHQRAVYPKPSISTLICSGWTPH